MCANNRFDSRKGDLFPKKSVFSEYGFGITTQRRSLSDPLFSEQTAATDASETYIRVKVVRKPRPKDVREGDFEYGYNGFRRYLEQTCNVKNWNNNPPKTESTREIFELTFNEKIEEEVRFSLVT